jgi:hypothetical protein
VFAHEFGHHVYFTALTNNERKDWVTFWKNNQDLMPRWYAKKDADEGWAECYAVTYLPNPKLDTSWGYPKGYVVNPILAAKIKSYFTR